MTDYQRIQVSEEQGVPVVRFSTAEIIDPRDIEQIGDELNDLGRRSDRVVLDFTGVKFLSSGVLGKLLMVRNAMQQRDASLTLCCVNREVFEVFVMTKLDQVFDIRADVPSSLPDAE